MNNRLFSRKDLVRLIIPLIVDQFLQVAVGLSDSIMVARVGEAAVSGVSLVDTVMLLIINIFTALATGGAVIAGQYLGRKDPKTGCEATAQLFNFTFLFSIFIMILGYLGQNVILYHVFGKIEADVMADSPAMAKAQPCNSAYTMYSGMAQNMNMNSSGSVTPVRKTASAVEMNMDLYLARLSVSTRRYIASAMPSSRPVAPIIWPTLKRAGVTVVSSSL